MANEDFNRSESGIPYPAAFRDRTPWKDQADAIDKADAAAAPRRLNDLDRDGIPDTMTFAEVLDQRNENLDTIEAAREKFDAIRRDPTMNADQSDYLNAQGQFRHVSDVLAEFEKRVASSVHAEHMLAYVAEEDRSVGSRLVDLQLASVTQSELVRNDGTKGWDVDTTPRWSETLGLNTEEEALQALGSEARSVATNGQHYADPEALRAVEAVFEEVRKEHFRDAMAEMDAQLDRDLPLDVEALRRLENQQRDIDPDSEAAMLAKEDRKRAEFESGEFPNRWVVETVNSSDDVEAVVLRTASALEADRSFREAADRRVVDLDRQDYAADHLGPENGVRYLDDRSDFRTEVEWETAQQSLGADVAKAADPRWTVQEFDAAKGVYVPVLETSDVLAADARFSQTADTLGRVFDNELGDYAAEWRKERDDLAAGTHYHERSQFGALVNEAEAAIDAEARDIDQTQGPNAGVEVRADIAGDATRSASDFEAEWEYQEMIRSLQAPQTLQEAIDRRALLQDRVDLHSEAVSASVDRLHSPGADPASVQQSYELAAKDYAAAQQGLGDFRREPSTVPDVANKFRELEAAERVADDASLKAVEARVAGAAPEVQASAAAAEKAAQERLAAFLQREGAALPSEASKRTDNTIERGLSEAQIQTLVAGDRSRKPSPDQAIGSPAEGQNQVRDFSAFADAAARDKLVPETVASTYRRDGEKFLDPNDPKRVAFVDKGNRLQTIRTFDDKAVASMIETADARGWTEITVRGDEAFRRKAYIEAAARGIDVKGYEPTEQDKARAEQLGKQTGHGNAIEKNETLDAYRASRDADGKQKRDAAREHPELAKAFALESAAQSFAKQRLRPEDQSQFVARTRENIERDLAQGKQIPEIRRRQETDRRQEHGMER